MLNIPQEVFIYFINKFIDVGVEIVPTHIKDSKSSWFHEQEYLICALKRRPIFLLTSEFNYAPCYYHISPHPSLADVSNQVFKSHPNFSIIEQKTDIDQFRVVHHSREYWLLFLVSDDFTWAFFLSTQIVQFSVFILAHLEIWSCSRIVLDYIPFALRRCSIVQFHCYDLSSTAAS